MASSSSSSSSSGSPCAACKFLRRKCTRGCIFAPCFPPEEPQKFANIHKIFGASNVAKLLNELPAHRHEDAVSSLAYEAEARIRDPVYGCIGTISVLQRQIHRLQKELEATNVELLRYTCGEIPAALPPLLPPPAVIDQVTPMPVLAAAAAAAGGTQHRIQVTGRRIGIGGGGGGYNNYYQVPARAAALPMACPFWGNNICNYPNQDLEKGTDGGEDFE